MLPTDIGLDDPERLNLSVLFSGGIGALRPLLLAPGGTFADPTFGGIAPDFTQKDIGAYSPENWLAWLGWDDHGDTLQEATDVGLPSDTAGTLAPGDDEDYFRLSVPSAGTLIVETTGSTDTHGTLYSATGGDLASNDDSDSDTNFRIVHQASAGTYYVRVVGYDDDTTGSYTLRVRFTAQ